jgi:8-oxo-dGTP diphosphatase
MLDVCCAIIINGSEILAVQRDMRSQHSLKWEFPGGKINIGETAGQCIVREIREELCITIQILNHQLDLIEHDYGNFQIRLIPFLCEITSGEIKLTEHIEMKWLGIEDLGKMDWAEADRKLIEKNRQNLKIISQG